MRPAGVGGAGQLDQFEADFRTDLHRKRGDLVDLGIYSGLLNLIYGFGNFEIESNLV
jgi:hypothetical protein